MCESSLSPSLLANSEGVCNLLSPLLVCVVKEAGDGGQMDSDLLHDHRHNSAEVNNNGEDT